MIMEEHPDPQGDQRGSGRHRFLSELQLRRKEAVPVAHLVKYPREYISETLRTRTAAANERRLLHQARAGRDVCWESTDEPEPLVTVRISTYNRGPLVVERAIASAIRQTYERLEILVIGDHCDQATARAVGAVTDPRVRFINLAERGIYPSDPMHFWMVVGYAPANAALAIAQGKWIAPCDDDDEFTDDHVEVLLGEARRRRLEFVWSKTAMEVDAGTWAEVGTEPLALGHITHGSVLYAGALRLFRYSDSCWKLARPGDWDLWSRMRRAGVKMGFLDRVTYRYWPSSHGKAVNASRHP
jgi:hypothetical protein